MSEDFLIKEITRDNIEQELCSIGFDKAYMNVAKNKYNFISYKIYNLTPVQATILKQTALSCGADCAVHREVLTHNIDYSDVILAATNAQLNEIIKKLYVQPFGLKILAKNLENIKTLKPNATIIRNKNFNWQQTYIMGILNCTPDSFSDGGEFNDEKNATAQFHQIIKNGAHIVDIGGESTAPQNSPIKQDEEILRLENIVKKCRAENPEIPLSIDTRNALTAKKMLTLGADIINDVSGFVYDEKMAQIVAEANAHCVLTFNDIIKENCLDETIKGLIKRVKIATSAGILKDKIILDVGLGFNKTFDQNIELIKKAKEIVSLGFPVLYGLSRKSFVQKITGLPPKETTQANISLGVYLASQGVNILRVHDVLAHNIAFNALDKVIYD